MNSTFMFLRKKLTILLIFLASFAMNLQSQVLHTESFNYTINSLLTANGYTAHSGAGVLPVKVTGPALTYSNYPGSGLVNAISIDTTGEDVNYSFTSQNSGDVYASFLASFSKATITGDYFFHLGPSNLTTTLSGRVFAKSDATGNLAFGVSKASTSSIDYTGFNYSLNTTYLFVVRFRIVAGTVNDTVNMWINPLIGGSMPAPQLTSIDIASSDPLNIGGYAFRQGTGANAPRVILSNLRIGLSWNDILSSTLQVASPSFNPVPGTYVGTQNITISSTTTGANIYYTLDGTDPTSLSIPYTIPVQISATATLKARAYKTGMDSSNVSSGLYTILTSPPPIYLKFTGNPATGTAGNIISTFTVRALANGTTLDPTFTGTVALSKVTGPGLITGTLSKAAVAGIATFNDIVFDTAGMYTFKAEALGTFNDTASITINPAAPAPYLSPGSIAFISYQTDNPDKFAFINIDSIKPLTEITFTDIAWNGTILSTTEDSARWTAPATGLSKGTVVIIEGNTANIGSVTGGLLGLSTSGEQILAYEGTKANPLFIAGLSSTGWITTGTPTTNQSYLPAVLTLGINAIGFATEMDNGYYKGPVWKVSNPQIKNYINNPANWLRNDAFQTWPNFQLLFNFIDTISPTALNAWATSPSTVKISFSEQIDSTGILTSNYTGLGSINSAVLNSGLDTVTLSLSTPLANGIPSTLTISGIKDYAGNIMLGTNVFNIIFGSLIDTIPPIPMAASAISAIQVKVVFNEAVDTTAENLNNYNGLGTINSAIRNFSKDTVTLSLATPLTFATPYTLTVNGVKDTAGNIMTGPKQFPIQFGVIIVDTIAGWTFPTTGTNRTANKGTPTNLTKQIAREATTTYTDAIGYTTRAISTTGWDNGNGTKFWVIDINTMGYQTLKLSSRQFASTTGPRDFKVQYRIGATGTWTDLLGATILDSANWTFGFLNNVPLPAACENSTSLGIRWIMTSNTAANGTTVASTGTNRIDDIFITGTPGAFVDTIPPTVLKAYASNLNTVKVVFDEPVGISAETTTNYTGLGAITSAIRSSGNDTVTLNLTNPLTFGVPYVVSINNIRDTSNNLMTLVQQFTVQYGVIIYPATLPTYYDWTPSSSYPTGWINVGLTTSTTGHNAANSGNFDTQNDSLIIFYDTSAVQVNYWHRRSGTGTTYVFDVKESVDGITYNSLISHNNTTNSISNTIWNKTTLTPAPNSRYIAFIYSTRPALTNIWIDEVEVLNTIPADTTPPSVLKAWAESNTSVKVRFSEKVNSTAENVSNYTGITTVSMAVRNASLDTVTLTLSTPLVTGQTYNLVIANVKDTSDNTMASPQTFQVGIGIPPANIVITEIMYNPPEIGTDTLEYLELYNNGATTVDLLGYYFSEGITFTFPTMAFQAGKYIVLAANPNAVNNSFVISSLQYTGSLSNSGERVVLKNALGQTVDSVSYGVMAPWPTQPNGVGPSLTLCNPNLDNSLPVSWSVSTEFLLKNANNDSLFGTPGRACDSITGFAEYKQKPIRIYPNPSHGKFNIEFSTSGQRQLYIINMIGKTVFELSTSERDIYIDIEHLPKGMYFLKTTEANSEWAGSYKMILR